MTALQKNNRHNTLNTGEISIGIQFGTTSQISANIDSQASRHGEINIDSNINVGSGALVCTSKSIYADENLQTIEGTGISGAINARAGGSVQLGTGMLIDGGSTFDTYSEVSGSNYNNQNGQLNGGFDLTFDGQTTANTQTGSIIQIGTSSHASTNSQVSKESHVHITNMATSSQVGRSESTSFGGNVHVN